MRMVAAPAREANCSLEAVTVNAASIEFNQTWQTLGMVSMSDMGIQDPFAEENKALVCPRACAMGGTAISVVMNATQINAFDNTGSTLTYMVLTPKPQGTTPSGAF